MMTTALDNSDVGVVAPIRNAFTCTGPYAMLILAGVKLVENRSAMPMPSEGRCAISVSKKFSQNESFVGCRPTEFERSF